MAPQTTPESQPDERPLDGICLDCGLGYTPRVPHATKCYACWRAARTASAPLDERAQRRYRQREERDGTTTPAYAGDDRTFALATNSDGTTPAWRANLARAVTYRLRAGQTTDPAEQRRLRSAAYDLERLARIQRYDAANAPASAPLAGRAAMARLVSELQGMVVA
jgi:hypothetical protein